MLYLQPLLRNPPRKLPNSVKLRSGYGYNAVQGHPSSPSLVPIESESKCDFLLVIITNLVRILHRFRDIAFDISKIAIFGYPSCVKLPRRRGSPGTISVKFPWMSADGQRTKWCRNIAENFNRLSRAPGRTNVTDRRQTTDRRTVDDI